MNKFIAKTILTSTKLIGSSGLAVARRVMPISMKRVLSRFVTNNIPKNAKYIKSKNGHLFEVIAEPVFLHLRMEGYYEKSLSDIASKYIHKNDIVVDIGANFGWYTTLFAQKVGNLGKVYSYEPNAKTFNTLTNNIRANNYEDRVFPKNCGLGAESSQATLVADDGESAIGYLNEINDSENNSTQDAIDIYPIDELLAEQIGKISYVKIDVEGFESFVLDGGRKLFNHDNAPVIQMEFNTEALARQNIDCEDFAAELMNLPMKIYTEYKGKLKLMREFSGKSNADLFFIPINGQFSNRSPESLIVV